MTDRPDRSDRSDLDARLALVQAYVDGEADERGRAAVDADPELAAEAAAQHELRVELGRLAPSDSAVRERAIAAALAAFDALGDDSLATGAEPAPTVVAPPPASLSARRRARWLMPAAAALAAVVGGAVVAVVATSSDSDSDEATEQVALDAGEPADTAADSLAGEGTLRVLAGTATEEAELAATEAISDDAAPAATDAAEAAGDAATTAPTAAAAAAPEALPRLESAADLAAFAARLVAGDAGAGPTTVAAPVPPAGEVGDCGPDVLAWAELVDGEVVRVVAVLIDDDAGEAIALAADTCTEVLRAPMP